MFRLPQETEVQFIIPAIRRELARALINEYKVTYENTGRLLGVTKCAISQYLSGKRAAKIKIHEKVLPQIQKSAQRMASNKSNALIEMQRIIKFIRKKKLHCEVCGGIVDGKLHDCKQVIPLYKEL